MTWVIRRGKKNGEKKASNVVVYVQISHSLNENAFDRYLNKVVSGDLRFQVRQKIGRRAKRIINRCTAINHR